MGSQEERRKHKRIPFTEDVLINNTILAKSVDISEGGMYIHTGRSFKVKSIVDVTMQMKDGKLTLKAIVQYDQPSIGMGLKFIDMDDAQKNKLRQLIERITITRTQAPKGKKRVLLVEDDETSRRISKSKLMLEGFHVIDANDGIEAIKFLENEIPDLIILDLCMQKLDGFKVLAIIRESPQWKNIPVIVFSAKGAKDVIDKVINAGADEFLVKMMTSPSKLLETARNVLNRKSGQDQ